MGHAGAVQGGSGVAAMTTNLLGTTGGLRGVTVGSSTGRRRHLLPAPRGKTSSPGNSKSE